MIDHKGREESERVQLNLLPGWGPSPNCLIQEGFVSLTHSELHESQLHTRTGFRDQFGAPVAGNSAGGYDSFAAAQKAMTAIKSHAFPPKPAANAVYSNFTLFIASSTTPLTLVSCMA